VVPPVPVPGPIIISEDAAWEVSHPPVAETISVLPQRRTFQRTSVCQCKVSAHSRLGERCTLRQGAPNASSLSSASGRPPLAFQDMNNASPSPYHACAIRHGGQPRSYDSLVHQISLFSSSVQLSPFCRENHSRLLDHTRSRTRSLVATPLHNYCSTPTRPPAVLNPIPRLTIPHPK
jgi:hypothetical protein